MPTSRQVNPTQLFSKDNLFEPVGIGHVEDDPAPLNATKSNNEESEVAEESIRVATLVHPGLCKHVDSWKRNKNYKGTSLTTNLNPLSKLKVLCFSLISLYLAGMLSPKGFLPVLPPRSCMDSIFRLLTVVIFVDFSYKNTLILDEICSKTTFVYLECA